MWIYLLAIVVGLVVVRWFWKRISPYPGGQSGATFRRVPWSSKALQTELKDAAYAHMTSDEVAALENVLNLMNEGRVQDALLWFDESLAKKNLPEPVQVLLTWGKSNIYQRIEEPEKEAILLEQLIRIRPHPVFENNLGQAYRKLGKIADSEKHFLESLRLADGNYPLARYNLGLLYCSIGRTSDAEMQLQALTAAEKDVPPELLSGLRSAIRFSR
jgi:tetratricopeptide (TPR) repeat protein